MHFVDIIFFSFKVACYVYTVKLANGSIVQPIPAAGRATTLIYTLLT
jgi:hypothetical protein